MIITLVQFQLPILLNIDEVQILFTQSASSFYHVPGLIQKYFLLSDDGKTAGGIYFWNCRKNAEQFYGDGFSESIAATFGTEPTIAYFESPVSVDNTTANVTTVH